MKFVLRNFKQSQLALILLTSILVILFCLVLKSNAQTESNCLDSESINCNDFKYNGYVANWKDSTGIIDNEVYSVGDLVKNTNLKVISISEYKIVLQNNNCKCEIIHIDQANYKK